MMRNSSLTPSILNDPNPISGHKNKNADIITNISAIFHVGIFSDILEFQSAEPESGLT